MDINEFHLLHKKNSPLFSSDLLRNIVQQALLDEKVPHSRPSSSDGQHVTNIVHGNEKTETVGRCTLISADSALRSCSTVMNESKLQQCAKKPRNVLDSSFNTVPTDTLKSNLSSSLLSCSTVFQHSHKEYALEPQLVSALVPDGPSSLSSQQCHSHVQPMENEAIISSTNGFSENATFINANSMTQKMDNNSTHNNTNNNILRKANNIKEKNTCGTFVKERQSPSTSAFLGNSENDESAYHGPTVLARADMNLVGNSCNMRQQFLSTAEEGKDKKKDTVKGEQDTIIPVEIGKVDEDEMLYIIKTIVAAQSCFDDFPNRDEQEEKCQEQDMSLQPKLDGSKLAGSAVSTEKEEDTRKVLMEVLVKYFEQKISQTVRFAKQIPGFLTLSRDDQASLIAASRIESDLISSLRSVDVSSKSFSSMDGQSFCIEEMRTFFPQESIDLYLEGALKVKKLNATTEEGAVLRAIALTYSDRCELTRREKVEDIQNRLVSCLYYIVKNRPVSVGVRMGQLFDFLVFCRKVTDVDLKMLKGILLETERFSSHPIVKEVL